MTAQPSKRTLSNAREENIYTLIVDGNSLLYSSMADPKINSDGIHIGGVFQFLLQLKIMMRKKDFDYVYVTFDNEYSGQMRYEIYHPYKANRDKHYEDNSGLSDYGRALDEKLKAMSNAIFGARKNKKFKSEQEVERVKTSEDFIDENFARERDILMNCFNELYIRWFFDDIVEGDDIIAYYVLHKKDNEKVVIVSSDEDLSQLISEDVCIYNQRLKRFITDKNFKEIHGFDYHNVALKKIFCGDKSDNIGNISGLSENKLMEIMPEIRDREVTIDEVKNRVEFLSEERIKNKKKNLQVYENIINGVSKKQYDGDFFEINEKIINLKKPLVTESLKQEMEDTMYAPMSIEDRTNANLYSILLQSKIEPLLDSNVFSSFFLDFKSLENKEKKRYADFIKNQKE